MAADLIDFGIERSRHERFFGREDVLAAVDRHLQGAGASGRWVLVTGGPGMGKSAILSRWLDLEEQRGRRAPHHFLRRDVMDWDRPETVARSLSAQIEARYPAQKDAEARPESRLIELLARVSKNELAPRGERLVLVVDGLDEARSEGAGQNPLPGFLPYALPPRVHALCASRPQYPHLGWLESRGNVRRIDLDAPEWTGSNEQACRAFWGDQAPRFTPRLDSRLVEEAIARAEGNLLYAVKLREWLEEQPVEQRRVERLPRGLSGFLEQIWQQLRGLPREQLGLVTNGLGLVCAAREALPIEEIDAAGGWRGMEAGEDFLGAARALLLEEPASWRGARAYRPYHEAFRAFVTEKLGPKRMAELHRRLLDTTARWPAAEGESDFRRRYAARHAIAHALAAGERAKVRGLCRDIGLLEALCGEDGPAALEGALRLAAKELGDGELDVLYRAVRSESHWLREAPEALPELVYNRLCSAGWEAERIARTLHFPRGLPRPRLRHPVRLWTGEERTLHGHSDRVNACVISPDGQRIISACRDRTLKVWDLATGQLLSTLEGHSASVTACAISPDGRRIVSASDDRTLKVWDLATGQLLSTLEGHSASIYACAINPDGRRIVSASWDRTLNVWDLATGQLLSTLEGHSASVTACAISPDGQRIVSASDDRTLKVWDLATGQLLSTLEGHSAWVTACAISPAGQRIVSTSRDRTLKVWDLATGQLLSTLEGHSASVTACAISPDGRRIVSASWDRTLKVWDLAAGQLLSTLEGHSASVTACAISPDGQRIVSASWDRTLKVWDLAIGQLLSALEGHSASVTACAISPDGQRVVSACRDRTLKVWDLATGQLLSTLEGHSASVTACAISPDGQRIVSACRDSTLKVWDLATGQLLSTLEDHSASVTACAISPDGRRIVSASDDGTLKVWGLATGQLLSTLEDHSASVTACAISPDGRRIVSASDDGTLKVWDLATGQLLSTLEDHSASVTACAISPDGQRIVSASRDRTLKVWDLATGQLLSTLEGHSASVTACAISPDGQRIVSASWDRTLKVWDLATGQLLATLEGHSASVAACAISPDGQRVVSASGDRTLKVWKTSTGECLGTARGSSRFLSVAVSQELLCAGDENGNFWRLYFTAPAPIENGLPMKRAIRLFFSYSHKDEAFRDELETHFALLEREGLLQSWHDRRIAAGDARAGQIDKNLDEAEVILLLVSADFVASDYCFDGEMRRALERHDAGDARVIPVILRPTDWHSAPFARLQALPKDARPVTLWQDRDEAWTDVVKGIRRAVEALRARSG
ncbi:WD-repeat protein [Sorangium cellulosum So ce56]|uniref:WD-repeat protein n=1 Tax=Sorangium cellulosum (strain So ce56) TaxID=448385 RepID=A9GSK2_SORC5|nr:AAA family ATPase [Sorangium cellulosum]CAN93790.1 WD-repeat protein [Sorangium cellulosum So ce56]